MNNDKNWAINSYKKIYCFDTLENSIKLIENLKNEILQKTMIFFMKNDINPIWEDPNNREGGCFCYKIDSNDVLNIWKTLCYSLIGNSLTLDSEILSCITGISISSKKNFYIIKIWINSIKNIQNIQNIQNKTINLENLINDISINNEFHYDPFNIHLLCNISPQNSIFKKHDVIY
jgi:hypothetical protein